MIRKSRFALLILVVLISTSPAIGTRARHNFQTSTDSTNAPVTIPFELVTRHIMLKVRINNSRPLSFVFDTGDKVGIVDAEVAKELGLKPEGQVRVGGAGAETLPGSLVKEASWMLPGLEGFSQPVTMALPLGRMAARLGH